MPMLRLHAARDQGLTLVELMVSLLVGLIVVLAATALLLSVQRSYSVQDDLLRIDESGRYALEVVTRLARQAGFAGGGESKQADVAVPSVLGIDAASLPRDSAGISEALSTAVNGSDVLAIRHAASGRDAVPNCAGFQGAGEGEPLSSWSIFYVGRDAAGEPQLYCKYEGEHGWSADAIVSGVEGFQVLYGIDSDENGLPDRMLSASAIGAPDMMEGSLWNRVVMIRIAMLLRGHGRQHAPGGQGVFDLFGPAYSEDYGRDDTGVRLNEADLAANGESRVRKVVQATIFLRNTPAGREP